ncbi:hypothetical protein C8P63_1498 [Melghirimyces profundicolus]|uniref:Uncharacterized protein n=1 Tax=Melghirimyces profundicolus TaxID=1242148 RepID=A0A2T6AVK2_9BACL|nr:hypothetical protein [Melghirimyces profundicolus]PTX47843.1 hypothetical protein C8P63_1498 [Melghirimyces profundicolus]
MEDKFKLWSRVAKALGEPYTDLEEAKQAVETYLWRGITETGRRSEKGHGRMRALQAAIVATEIAADLDVNPLVLLKRMGWAVPQDVLAEMDEEVIVKWLQKEPVPGPRAMLRGKPVEVETGKNEEPEVRQPVKPWVQGERRKKHKNTPRGAKFVEICAK